MIYAGNGPVKFDLEIQLLHLTAIMCWPSPQNAKQYSYYLMQEMLGIAATQYFEGGKSDPIQLSQNIGFWLGEMIAEIGSWPALADATILTFH